MDEFLKDEPKLEIAAKDQSKIKVGDKRKKDNIEYNTP